MYLHEPNCVHIQLYLVQIFSVKATNEKKDIPADFLDVGIAKQIGKLVHKLVVGEEFAIAKYIKEVL